MDTSSNPAPNFARRLFSPTTILVSGIIAGPIAAALLYLCNSYAVRRVFDGLILFVLTTLGVLFLFYDDLPIVAVAFPFGIALAAKIQLQIVFRKLLPNEIGTNKNWYVHRSLSSVIWISILGIALICGLYFGLGFL